MIALKVYLRVTVRTDTHLQVKRPVKAAWMRSERCVAGVMRVAQAQSCGEYLLGP